MSRFPDPDLVKITEIYMVPCSFLVAALGTADTNPHRALVSLLGVVISSFWWVSSREAVRDLARHAELAGAPLRTRMLSHLSIVFVSGWLLSLIGHVILWNQRLGD